MSALFNGVCYYQYPGTTLPPTTGPYTLCGWVNLSDVVNLQALINGVDATLGFGYQLGIRTSQLVAWAYGGVTLVACAPPAANTWTFVSYSYDGTTHALSINAVPQASATTAVVSGQPALCQLGGNQWAENMISGSLEDWRIYNRVLLASELKTIMNASGQDMIVNGLVAHWPMNELIEGQTLSAGIPENYRRTCTVVGTAYAVAQAANRLTRRIV